VRDADDRSATVGDVRRLRRWLIVTAVWAVAATGIAVAAYLAANDDDEAQIATAGNQARAVQRQLDNQLSRVEDQLSAAPSTEAVQDLQKSVADIRALLVKRDRQASGFDQRVRDIRERLGNVEQSVQDLEQAADTGG
jgi:hypothetical protein